MSFIPIEFYATIYYTLLSICVFFTTVPLLKYENHQQIAGSKLKFYTFILFVLVIAFIGLRDPWGNWRYLADTATYTRWYEILSSGNDFVSIKDPGFYIFMKLCTKFMSVQLFYVTCALLYLIPPYLAFKRWFGRNAFFALLMFVVSMSFWGYGINGVRNGLATSFVIFAFSLRKEKIKMFLVMLLAISFHKTVLLPILVYFFTLKFSDTKIFIKIWVFVVVFSFFFGNNVDELFKNYISPLALEDSRGQDIFLSEIEGKGAKIGYRFDFILYSSIAIFLGYIYTIKRGVNDVFYIQLLNTYIIVNALWVFLIFAAYTNRIAYLSWFLMPIVMIYPLLKYNLFIKQNKLIAYLIFGSLGLTLLLYNK